MRVLSFIPAVLLAAAGFVAAAPAVGAVGNPTGVASCVTQEVKTRDVPQLQPTIDIFHGADAQLKPLNDKLSTAASGTPDVAVVADICVEIETVINTTVAKVQALVEVDLHGLDLTVLVGVILVVLADITVALKLVVQIVLVLGVSASGGLLITVGALLKAVASLLVVVKIYVVGDIAVILAPVLAVILNISNLLCVVLGLKIQL